MNSIEQLKQANVRADELAAQVVAQGNSAPDKVEERREELQTMSTDELIELVLSLEKVKGNSGAKVEDVARALLEDEQLAIFTYEQLAVTIRKHMPEAKTTGKGLASYVTKHKDDWNVVKRTRFALNPADIMAAVAGGEE